jgi:hypothetical protein
MRSLMMASSDIKEIDMAYGFAAVPSTHDGLTVLLHPLQWRERTYTLDMRFVSEFFITDAAAMKSVGSNMRLARIDTYGEGVVYTETENFIRIYSPIESLEWEDQPLNWSKYV